MPIYAFDCKQCESNFEKLVRSSLAIDEIVCPECGSVHVQRRVSTIAVRVPGGASRDSSSSSAGCSTSGGT